MKVIEFQQKIDHFVNSMVDNLKASHPLAKDAVTCPSCMADITEWWLRRELSKNFVDIMMKNGMYPEP